MSSNWKALAGGCVIGAVCVSLVQSGSSQAVPSPMDRAPVAPEVVGIAATQIIANGASSNRWRVFRQWADGSVDCIVVQYPGATGCEHDEVCFDQFWPASCAGDVDHNGEVGIDDLVGVINTWGDCPTDEQ